MYVKTMAGIQHKSEVSRRYAGADGGVRKKKKKEAATPTFGLKPLLQGLL